MAHVLVIGAGLSGCTTALRLADEGVSVTLIEKTSAIGGKVLTYGCKATNKCNNCGVCLSGGLWSKVEKHKNISIIFSAIVIDLFGSIGNFSVTLKIKDSLRYINNITAIVVSTGFEGTTSGLSAHLQIEGSEGIITGSKIETVMLDRAKNSVLKFQPQSVAFIQCFASRDRQEKAMYCSKVCCSYTTRAAKVIKYYYPECKIVFFYMELQSVANRDYYKELIDEGIEFIKCRPLKITGGTPAVIEYDEPAKGIAKREFDIVVLSEGIHPTSDASWMAETYGLVQNEHGFLNEVGNCEKTGIYVAGCAKTPLKIDETYADSITVANKILSSVAICGGL